MEAATSNADPAVMMIDAGLSGGVLKINARPITSRGLFRDLLDLREKGVTQVTLLVHEKITIKQIFNITAILNKAGFVGPSVKVFAFDKDKTEMEEMTFSPPYIFSASTNNLKPMHPPAAPLK